LNIAALGAPASLVGVTGQDEAADSLANSLQAAGVRSVFQRIAHQPTIVKLRVMSRHQQLLRIDFEEPFATDALSLGAEVDSLLEGIKVLVLSDYGKGALKNHQALIQAARAKGIPVLADPKGKDFSIYRGASLITPNLSEFETIVGRCADEAELVAKGLTCCTTRPGRLAGDPWRARHDPAAPAIRRCTCRPGPVKCSM
jgi:D-beta-D-heptose 7-phosphate kinase/D-beta-D-heptose 1-phosphate adenosyltransferase